MINIGLPLSNKEINDLFKSHKETKTMINQTNKPLKMFNLEFTVVVTKKWHAKVQAFNLDRAKERLELSYNASVMFSQYDRDDLEDIGVDNINLLNISEVKPETMNKVEVIKRALMGGLSMTDLEDNNVISNTLKEILTDLEKREGV